MLPAADLLSFAFPAILVALGAIACLVAEPFLGREAKHRILPWTGALFLLAAGAALHQSHPGHLAGMFAIDPVRAGLAGVLLAVASMGLAGLGRNLSRESFPGGEGYALVMLATLGVLGMILATNTVALFVCMELASLSIYPLVGMRRDDVRASEGLLKYFAMGAIFSGLFLYGSALSYGATGTLSYVGRVQPGRDMLLLTGFLLQAAGLLFKCGVVPFHSWSPDAYNAAPSGATGFMAGAVKLGAFTALGGLWIGFLLTHGLTPTGMAPTSPMPLDFALNPILQFQLGPEGFQYMMISGFRVGTALFGLLGLLSILVGSLSVLGQKSVRRLMAFSGVANAGFLVLALLLPSLFSGYVALDALWFYLALYALAAAGSLACFAALTGPHDEGDDIPSLAGAARRQPLVGAAFTVFLASLAGLPPAAGFLAKFQILSALLLNANSGWNLVIPVGALLLALVSTLAYFRLAVTLWSPVPAGAPEREPAGYLLSWVVSLSALAVLALTVFPKALF